MDCSLRYNLNGRYIQFMLCGKYRVYDGTSISIFDTVTEAFAHLGVVYR